MAIDTSKPDELRQRILDAFRSVPRPHDAEHALCPCDECRSLRASFGGGRWDFWFAVPPDRLDANFDKLPLMTPEAIIA